MADNWTSNARITFIKGHGPQEFEIPCLTLTEYVSAPVFAEDGRTCIGQKYALRGRGVFASDSAFLRFQNAFIQTGAVSGGSDSTVNFTAEIRRAGGSWVTLASYTRDVPDDTGGPKVAISSPQAIGTQYLAVEFSVEWQVSPVMAIDQASSLPFVAHTWQQTCALGTDGRVEWTVRGVLKAAPGNSRAGQQTVPAADGSVDEWTTRKPWVDLARLAIIPDVPGAGWRRKGYEFALDATGTTLAYQFTDFQTVTDLPFPAFAGKMDYDYEVSYPNFGWADVTATITMEGMVTTPYRDLIAAALNLSKVRVNPSGNILRRLKITEHAITDRRACTVVVGTRISAKNTAGTAILPISALVGAEFAVTRATANRTLPPYGDPDQSVVYMAPHWVENYITAAMLASSATAMVQPALWSAELPDENTTASVIVVSSGDDGMAAINDNFGGPFTNPFPVQSTGSGGAQTSILDADSKTVLHTDPGTVRMSSAQQSAPDFVFQTRKPETTLTETTMVTRMNQAPPRPVRPMPPGSMLVDEKWEITSGRPDNQGNLTFTGRWERVSKMLDGGGSASNGFSDVTQAGSDFRYWTTPNGILVGAQNPGLQSPAQSTDYSVLGNGGTDTRLATAGTVSNYRQA